MSEATFKRAMFAMAPDFALKHFSIKSRQATERYCARKGLADLSRTVSRRTSGRVASGPFKGMAIDYDVFPQHTSPKLLGTYEDELHQGLEELFQRSPTDIINIGTAEGYYAVGCAMCLPTVRVYGYDADPKARAATAHNAELNGVSSRVSSLGILKQPELESRLRAAQRPLIISDCEGGEADLLDPARVKSLAKSDLLIEVHPTEHEGLIDTVNDRFVKTHKLRWIDPRSTDEKMWSAKSHGVPVEAIEEVDERRGSKTPWLLAFARQRGS